MMSVVSVGSVAVSLFVRQFGDFGFVQFVCLFR